MLILNSRYKVWKLNINIGIEYTFKLKNMLVNFSSFAFFENISMKISNNRLKYSKDYNENITVTFNGRSNFEIGTRLDKIVSAMFNKSF